jgi:hypothetical protein
MGLPIPHADMVLVVPRPCPPARAHALAPMLVFMVHM